jgi:hypothetical protein
MAGAYEGMSVTPVEFIECALKQRGWKHVIVMEGGRNRCSVFVGQTQQKERLRKI